MNREYFKQIKFNNSGIGCLLSILLGGLFLTAIGLGWIVNGLLILFGFLLFAPAVAWLVINWWLKRNLVEDKCPVCNYEFTGFNNTQCRCPNCGEQLQVVSGGFQRLTPPGTIDIEAVEIQSQRLEGE